MKYLAIVFLAVTAMTQNSTQAPTQMDRAQAAENGAAVKDLAAQVPAARPEDVKSREALLAAIYDVISGPAGERDWNRFRSLFVPQARFTAVGRKPDGSVSVTLLGVDEFIGMAGAVFKSQGFYENAMVNRVQTFGNVSQVFSSYESRNEKGGKPFERGINSIQMFDDGKRWWVLSILWDTERQGNPLPKAMEKK
ncbi:MAG TPA: hypothetical protein VK763_13095 [Terriglobales bacterium]|nr:hypothetical protein [Terriglobales bacterium]